MTTEPKYTNAQIKATIGHLEDSQYYETADMLRSLLTERPAAMQGRGGEVVVAAEDARECVIEAIAGALGDAFDCTRVWSAWSYGTMSEDDFSFVREDEGRLGEIADAAIAALQPPQPVQSVSDEQWGLIRKTLMHINAAHILGSDASPKAVNEWRKWLTAALPENQQYAAIAQEKQS